jgi:hypothetical protein
VRYIMVASYRKQEDQCGKVSSPYQLESVPQINWPVYSHVLDLIFSGLNVGIEEYQKPSLMERRDQGLGILKRELL